MKIIYITLAVMLMTSCMSKVVKRIKTETPSNPEQVIIPFSSHNTVVPSTNYTHPLDTTIVIFVAVIAISFLPFILSGITFVVEYIFNFIKKLYRDIRAMYK